MEKKIKCLVVDDEEYFLKYLKFLFEFNGFEVFSSLNVDEALNIVKREKIEFIVSDIYIPGKDGFHLLSELKANIETSDIPVLVVSSDDSKDVMSRALEMGASGYMCKPFLKHHLKKVSDMLAFKN
jgi:DNA-binding response OmpR family regulator